MSEELFVVVDEMDVVVGQRPRSEVHRLGLRHRAVHILVFNDRGEVFLQQRSLSKDSCPGIWDSSCSGHLDAGERYGDAAVRELNEELGLLLSEPLEYLFKLPASTETGMEFCQVYRGRAEGPFVLQPSEVRGGGWFFRWQIESWLKRSPEDFASGFRTVWANFLSWETHGRGIGSRV